MSAVKAHYTLPDKDIQKVPLTIEITMSVENWKGLTIGDKWPDWQVAAIIRDALDKVNEMAGRRYVVGHDLIGTSEE